jgi:multidrug resistance efflux pump
VILTGSLKAQKAEHFVVPQTSSWQNQIKWMVREGDPVKPGDPVVRFDTSTMTADIENIELTLQDKQEQKKQKLAEYQHQKLELGLKEKQAEIDYQKKQLDAAVPRGIESDYDYDQKQLEMKKSAEALKKAQLEKQVKLTTMVSGIKQLDLDIEQERGKLEKSEKTLENMTLKAKTAGTVVYARHLWQDRKIQVGDSVPISWTVATIPDPNSLQVEAWANETHINHVKPGQRADIILDAYPNKRFSGTIKDVLKSAEKRKNWGKAHYFNVSIELDNRDLTIMKPGMSAKCLVHTREIPQVLLIPIEMAHFDGQLFRVKPKGKETLEIKPLGVNAFYLAVSKDGTIDEGTLLEKIKGDVQ